MSRIGQQPITIKQGVTVEIAAKNSYGGQTVKIKGGKGEISVDVRPEIDVSVKDGLVELERKEQTKVARSYHGLYRTLIQNAMIGVVDGYEKELKINGIGYKAQLQGDKLQLMIGYTHPIDFQIPEGIKIEVKDSVELKISGIDKQLVGETAAKIRGYRKPEPYKGKGIRYKGEIVRRKAGKAAA